MADISSAQLGKGIARLQESVAAYEAEPANLMIRDSVIKRFEFTFELAQSLLRKYVEERSINAKERERLSFPTLIRTASQDGLLLDGLPTWQQFRDARNKTSHTYNEDQALAVMAIVPEFQRQVAFLFSRLEEEMLA
jgi:nucleotidyltransferase substrate binding protein (TIGR01987 family)